MKKTPLLIIFIITLCFIITGCNNVEPTETPTADGEYILEIKGITDGTIEVTKAQILSLYETKGVEYTAENLCYASDKLDDDGNLIPHTLKGVYLDDILKTHAYGAKAEAYTAMLLKGADGYETVLTSNTFNIEQGGSKMIIAFEYDGVTLNPSEKSGALRAVFPDQVNNSWVKQLKSITFTDAELNPPSPDTLNFIEMLGDSYNGSFVKDEVTDAGSFSITYYGVSVKKLLEGEILKAQETDKMYLKAWDFITNGTEYYYREYTNWKSYEYYEDAYLVYSYKEGEGEIEDYDRAPKLDGENILSGMSVKNILSLSVGTTALVSLDIAYERFDPENTSSIDFSDILTLVNMPATGNYTVYDTQDNIISLSGSELLGATLEKSGSAYILHYGEDDTLNLKSMKKS